MGTTATIDLVLVLVPSLLGTVLAVRYWIGGRRDHNIRSRE
jgi:hypothetical protein